MLETLLRRSEFRLGGSSKDNHHALKVGAPVIIELRKVVKIFESQAGRFAALKGVDLQIRSGEFISVVGKSGSGKSTLMNMITGIDRPTSGEVIVGETKVHKLSEGKMAKWRGRNIGVVFQFFQLLPTLSIKGMQ